jgi:Cu/Ag efflux protein CusF
MKNLFVALLISTFVITGLTGPALCQDNKAAAKAVAKTVAPAAEKAPIPQNIPAKPTKPMATVLFGSVSKIDNANPADVKLEIKSMADDSLHVVDVPAQANIVKVTDLSELKTGDTVRIMARNIEGKEVAMNIIFGKLKMIPRPKPASVTQAAPTTPPAVVKQEKAKK